MSTANLHELVGAVVRQCLTEGIDVELDGLGVFKHTETGLTFVPAEGPRVFISYVREDYEAASKLYAELEAAGLRPWLDRKKLLPGQNWRGCVERAIDTCDFFIACFSSHSVKKRGQFPYEVRYALRTADRMPLDEVFVLPVRVSECRIPARIGWHMQHVDLFPYRDEGIRTLIEAIQAEWAGRQARVCD
jgi:hypothetical protein